MLFFRVRKNEKVIDVVVGEVFVNYTPEVIK